MRRDLCHDSTWNSQELRVLTFSPPEEPPLELPTRHKEACQPLELRCLSLGSTRGSGSLGLWMPIVLFFCRILNSKLGRSIAEQDNNPISTQRQFLVVLCSGGSGSGGELIMLFQVSSTSRVPPLPNLSRIMEKMLPISPFSESLHLLAAFWMNGSCSSLSSAFEDFSLFEVGDRWKRMELLFFTMEACYFPTDKIGLYAAEN